MNTILKVGGCAFMVIGFLVIVGVRIKGVHLTEGELVMEYWVQLLTAFVFVICGYMAAN